MDKKKVIELIKKAETFLHNSKKEGLDYLYDLLTDIEYEVLKPDWISVEDELPPIGMRVWVCNIENPDIVVPDFRSEMHNCKFYDGYGFLICNHVTHWRKIDKLEV